MRSGHQHFSYYTIYGKYTIFRIIYGNYTIYAYTASCLTYNGTGLLIWSIHIVNETLAASGFPCTPCWRAASYLPLNCGITAEGTGMFKHAGSILWCIHVLCSQLEAFCGCCTQVGHIVQNYTKKLIDNTRTQYHSYGVFTLHVQRSRLEAFRGNCTQVGHIVQEYTKKRIDNTRP